MFGQLRACVKLIRLSREVLGLWRPSIRLDLTVQIFFVSEMIAHSCVTSDGGYVESPLLACNGPTNVHSRYATDKVADVVTSKSRTEDA